MLVCTVALYWIGNWQHGTAHVARTMAGISRASNGAIPTAIPVCNNYWRATGSQLQRATRSKAIAKRTQQHLHTLQATDLVAQWIRRWLIFKVEEHDSCSSVEIQPEIPGSNPGKVVVMYENYNMIQVWAAVLFGFNVMQTKSDRATFPT